MKPIHRLEISRAVSRGADTCGYNICRLDDSVTQKRFECLGGGYDMIGTVVADWFESTYQNHLAKLSAENPNDDSRRGRLCAVPGFYGAFVNHETGHVTLDGRCGIESIRTIIEACGFDVQWSGDKKGLEVFLLTGPEFGCVKFHARGHE